VRARTPIMRDFPTWVQVFIGNKCNLRCSFCVPRQEAWSKGKKWVLLDRKDEDISPELLDRVSEVFTRADFLYLTGGGEPFITKAFWKFIDGEYPSNGLLVNTNATLLTDKNIDRLFRYPGKLNIGVSVNAGSREIYEKVVGRDCFDEVIAGSTRLIKRREQRAEECKVFFTMVVVKDNLPDMVKFVKLAVDCGADSAFIQYGIFPHDYEWPLDKNFKSSEQDVSADPKLFAQYEENYAAAVTLAESAGITLSARGIGDDAGWEGPCRELFDFIRIEQTGESSACCHVWDINTGSVNQYDNFMSLWNNPQRVEMRKTVLKGEFPRQCQSLDCAYYRTAKRREKDGLPVELRFPEER
jgi:MoaA/NifB/PqqE/SkfB family radical SAM enzyme